MSILNIESDGLYSVLLVLTLSLVRFGPQSRQSLLDSCGASLTQLGASTAKQSDKSKRLRNTLDTWIKLGLFEDNGEVISIVDSHKVQLGDDSNTIESNLPNVLRKIIFSDKNNENFWDSKDNRSSDFTRGMSWVLAQDISKFDTSSYKPIEKLENMQIPDQSKRVIQNDTRWSGLRDWGLALGFFEISYQFVVDPTEAIRESLNEIFGTEKELLAVDFIKKAADIIPVIDGGKYRIEVEKQLREEVWEVPKNNFISKSLARAIWRLEYEGLITGISRADTASGINYIKNTNETESITHIQSNLNSGK